NSPFPPIPPRTEAADFPTVCQKFLMRRAEAHPTVHRIPACAGMTRFICRPHPENANNAV
ncbi:hypothetical protein, partial [Neisseria sp. LACPHL-SPEC-2024-00856]|uniref:hypothetical protein n=1 Tax=Neisseria sp. LACPHL-SPEC-2024-00856 TaxID=3391057 RepID=UPI003A4DF6BA